MDLTRFDAGVLNRQPAPTRKAHASGAVRHAPAGIVVRTLKIDYGRAAEIADIRRCLSPYSLRATRRTRLGRLMRSKRQGTPSAYRSNLLWTLWSVARGLRRAKLAEASPDSGGTGKSGDNDSALWWSVIVPLLIPLLTLLSLTAVFRLTNADIAICRVFFGAGDGSWSIGESQPWKFAYSYGTLPGVAIGIGGLAIGAASLAWRRLRAYRDAGFFLAAVLAIGPGLLVNGLFKPYWCRPRPKQIVEFGGTQQFVHVWGWTSERMCKSFPSGHASMGFYLLAPAFVLYRRRRRLALAFAALGVTWGSVLGVARIAQGGHFPSDVLWSAGMTYLSALALCYLFKLGERGTLRNGADHPARFEPIVIGAEAARSIRPVAEERLSADQEADRRKAA